jgi:5'-nucleotidase
MRVLITNDDGIDSPGLGVLAATARDFGLDPLVAAPARDHSGVGAALIGADHTGRIRVENRSLPSLPDIKAVAVGASPALIVILALAGAFGPPPDAVLSGINDGPNLGLVVLYSGTVGAALSAAAHNKPALAVSLHTMAGDTERHWETAAAVTARVLPALTANEHPMVLNVNVPNRPADALRGIRRASLTSFGPVSPRAVVLDTNSVTLSWQATELGMEPGSDEELLRKGFATVTPLELVSEAERIQLPDFAGPASN